MRIRTLTLFAAGLIAAGFGGAALHAALGSQEPPAVGPEHKILQQMAGEWDLHMAAGGDESDGRYSVKSMPGGLFVTADFAAEFGGMPFHGHGIWGYDPMKKKYVNVWVDSLDPYLQIGEGDYDAKTATLTLVHHGMGMDGQPADFWHVTKFTDKDTMDFTLLIGSDDEKMEAARVHYTRKK